MVQARIVSYKTYRNTEAIIEIADPNQFGAIRAVLDAHTTVIHTVPDNGQLVVHFTDERSRHWIQQLLAEL